MRAASLALAAAAAAVAVAPAAADGSALDPLYDYLKCAVCEVREGALRGGRLRRRV